MQYRYKIFYDLVADEWNWLDAHNPIHGQNWRNTLLSVEDIEIYDMQLYYFCYLFAW